MTSIGAWWRWAKVSLFGSVSFEAFSHSKDLGANWRVHLLRVFGATGCCLRKASLEPTVLYICLLPSLLLLSGLSLTVVCQFFWGLRNFVLQLLPTCVSQCLGFFVSQFWSSLEPLALSKCSLEGFPNCRLHLSPNSFTLVSQFLQFSGAFGAGFRRGFWMVLSVVV